MKINPILGNNLINAYKGSKVAPSRPQRESDLDSVSFSEEAVTFSATFAKIKEALDLRSPEETARIDEIARQVKDGSYRVDSEKIAEKIIRDYIA